MKSPNRWYLIEFLILLECDIPILEPLQVFYLRYLRSSYLIDLHTRLIEILETDARFELYDESTTETRDGKEIARRVTFRPIIRKFDCESIHLFIRQDNLTVRCITDTTTYPDFYAKFNYSTRGIDFERLENWYFQKEKFESEKSFVDAIIKCTNEFNFKNEFSMTRTCDRHPVITGVVKLIAIFLACVAFIAILAETIISGKDTPETI